MTIAKFYEVREAARNFAQVSEVYNKYVVRKTQKLLYDWVLENARWREKNSCYIVFESKFRCGDCDMMVDVLKFTDNLRETDSSYIIETTPCNKTISKKYVLGWLSEE